MNSFFIAPSWCSAKFPCFLECTTGFHLRDRIMTEILGSLYYSILQRNYDRVHLSDDGFNSDTISGCSDPILPSGNVNGSICVPCLGLISLLRWVNFHLPASSLDRD